ncbi:MAG: ATP-binding protein, partial [Clostridia bacterium]|nr:ATP-binding protein [Clostridia bacterium]
MKKFKTESQKVLDLMINSIYTHKEIFIRELLSNASDAIDKLYYKSLTDGISGLAREDFFIRIEADKEARVLKISDNGIGMTEDELDNNLGVIARSGSREFKQNVEKNDEIGIIGQFGVGFYSAFMVSDRVEVTSKAYGEETAHVWSSNGSDGYEIKPAEKEEHGTTITLYIRNDTEEENYSEFLDEYKIRDLVKKYSDYIRYPIKMETTQYRQGEDGKSETYKADETLNSMVPLWKKNKNEITKEEYEAFYRDTFYDYEAPARVIHTSA